MSTNVTKIEGHLNAQNLKIAIVCARFNEFFVSKLLDGAIDALVRHGDDQKNITTAWVPGCYDMPIVVQRLAKTGAYDAIIALGVVIQGATPHASLINTEVAKALSAIALNCDLPVSYGIINADTIEQAIERSGTKAGNKGADAAHAAIEMSNLLRNIKKGK